MPPKRKHLQQHNNNNNHQQHHNNNQHHQQINRGHASVSYNCCTPLECLKPGKLIYLEDLGNSDLEIVKVICNNESCDLGSYMHADCFEEFQQTVLNYFSTCGRTKSWTDKQKTQNLWTKKGYDLAYKACSCKCGKGHLRKDLDWFPPDKVGGGGGREVAGAAAGGGGPGPAGHDEHGGNGQNPQLAKDQGGKKKKANKDLKPTVNISVIQNGPNKKQPVKATVSSAAAEGKTCAKSLDYHSPRFSSLPESYKMSPVKTVDNSQKGVRTHHTSGGSIGSNNNLIKNALRSRASSICSSVDVGSSISNIGSPIKYNMINNNSMGDINSSTPRRLSSASSADMEICSYAGAVRTNSPANTANSKYLKPREYDVATYFSRIDKSKFNPYQIMIDTPENVQLYDEVRNFVLTILCESNTQVLACVICNKKLNIYERLPVINGTLYLSPKKPSPSCIETFRRERKEYMGAVCLECIEGYSCSLKCKTCHQAWHGGSLILGGCYSFDIFASMVCCPSRFECENCHKLVMDFNERPKFYSDYSRAFACQNCGYVNHHFIKPLPKIYRKFSA